MPSLTKFKESVEKWGLVKALWAVFMRRITRTFMLCQIQTRTNEGKTQRFESQDDINIRLADRDELRKGAREMPSQLSEDFIESALSRGDICAAAFADSTMISFQWGSFTTANMNDQLSIEFRAPYRYGYKSYTRPDYRGRRIAKHVMRFCDAECLKRGYTHTIVYVETHNYASLANLNRLGNRCVGFAGFCRVLNWYFPFTTAGAKKNGFRLSRRGKAKP